MLIKKRKGRPLGPPLILLLYACGHSESTRSIQPEHLCKNGYLGRTVKHRDIRLDFLYNYELKRQVQLLRSPMKTLLRDRLHLLVSSAWVSEQVHNDQVHLIEVGFQDLDEYLTGHLPGASYLDINAFEGGSYYNVYSYSQIMGNLFLQYSRPYIQKLMSETTILYGKDTSCVCRAAWILMEMGFKDIRVVNGGKAKLMLDDLPMTKHIIGMIDPSDGGCHADILNHERKNLLLDYEAFTALDGRHTDVYSIRSIEEFNGSVSGYTYIDAKGKIPGSIHGGNISHYRNNDGTMASPDHIIDTLNLNSPKKKVFYCGTGWRASEVAFYVHALGYDCQLYDGGWFEWSSIAAIQQSH